jgi:uncharacterized protein involved in outer membrane biogenesis
VLAPAAEKIELHKLLYAIGGLIVLIVVGLLVGPSFFDWNAYKPEIVAVVKDALGRELRVAGDIKLSILPSPALSVQRVSLENVEGANNREMIAFDEIEVKVDISALLQGKIAVTRVRLVRPVIALEITKDGNASWDIKLPEAKKQAGNTSTSKTAPSTSGHLAVDVSLDSLKIENATITYTDTRSGLSERIENLTTEIAAKSLSGPFRAKGEATIKKTPVSFTLAIGHMTPDRPLPVSLQLRHEKSEADIRFTGNLSALTPDATLSGEVKVSAPNIALVARHVANASVPAVLSKALSLNAEVSVSATEFGINKLSLRVGDMSFAGAVHALLKPNMEIDIVLSSNKLDLDQLMKPPAVAQQEATGHSGASKIMIAQPSSNPDAPFDLPKDILVTFDLNVETASYKSGVIRNVTLRGALRNGAVTLERVAITLPGSSDISITGTVTPRDGLAQFEGDIAATSDNVRGLAQWLGVNPTTLPADRLRKFSYTSKLLATPKAAEITDIAIQLDATRINGGMAVELRDKPGIGLRLTVDKLNLDAYLPKNGLMPRPGNATASPQTSDPSPSTEMPVDIAATGLNRLLNTLDANIEITAGRLSFKGETAHNAKIDLMIFDNKVTIREASVGDFAGVEASLAGILTNKKGQPAFGIDYAIVVRDTARFARFVGAPLPISLARLGKVSSNGHVDAALEGLKATLRVKALGAETNINGSIENLLIEPQLDLAVSVKHSNLTALVRKFAPDYRPAAEKLGPLDASFRVQGTAHTIALSDIDVKAGPVAILGTINAIRPTGKTKLEIDLKTSEILLDLFLPTPSARTQSARNKNSRNVGRSTPLRNNRQSTGRWSSAPIALPIPQDIDATAIVEMAVLTKDKISLKNVNLQAVLASGNLALKSFTASLFSGKIQAKAALRPQGKKVLIDAELTVDKIDSRIAIKALTGHDRVEGPLSLSAHVATSGNSELTLLSALNGNLSLTGQAQILLTKSERSQISVASAGGQLLAALLGSKVRGLQRLTPITQLITSLDQAFGRNPAQLSGDLRIVNGVARTDNLTLSGQGNTATTRATIDLPRWQLSSATELVDDPQQEPLVTFDATGPIDAPSQTKVGGRLLRQGASSATEKAQSPLQQILPGLLSGSKSSGSQEQKKVNPGKLLEGLFKQLQR